MGWRTIYIENGQKISLHLNNLKIDDGDEFYHIPLEDIEMLMLNNYKMCVTVQLLCKLSNANICVIVCGKNGLPELFVSPYSGNYAAYKIQELQLRAASALKEKLWQKIVQGKIGNQVYVLDKHSGDCRTLEMMLEFQNEVLPGDRENREGLAAKLYFRGLFGDGFIRERESEEPVNLALNYGYSLVRAAVARAVIAKGFIPTIGIHHHNIYNHFNLADDFIEVYRPLIDDWAAENMQNEFFVREKRLALINFLNSKIIFDGKKYSILQSIPLYVDSIVKVLKTNNTENLIIPGAEIVEECE